MSSPSLSQILSKETASNVPVTSLFTRKECVGKGAFGAVYRSVHNSTAQVVALKIIELDTTDDDITEIQREVALLSQLRAAEKNNITSYYGCFLHKTELWIAMELASGGSIRTLMKATKIIEENFLVVIVREVLIALAYLHKQGVIHRDIKAANILLTQNGKILLCDFGVAAHLQTNSKRSTFIGTPYWMAPEVITDGKLYDTKADIWSLGITIYEMAVGMPPFAHMEALRAIATIPNHPSAELPESLKVSNEMREFLSFCLQDDPNQRHTAELLSKQKWITKNSGKPISTLRELITRYAAWVKGGGVRQSIADASDLNRGNEVDLRASGNWNFDASQFDTVQGGFQSGDNLFDTEGPQRNRMKGSRDHPLLRLFQNEDEDTQAEPSFNFGMPAPIDLGYPIPSMDTIKPSIVIPPVFSLDLDSINNDSDASSLSATNSLNSTLSTAPTSPVTLRGPNLQMPSSESLTSSIPLPPSARLPPGPTPSSRMPPPVLSILTPSSNGSTATSFAMDSPSLSTPASTSQLSSPLMSHRSASSQSNNRIDSPIVGRHRAATLSSLEHPPLNSPTMSSIASSQAGSPPSSSRTIKFTRSATDPPSPMIGNTSEGGNGKARPFGARHALKISTSSATLSTIPASALNSPFINLSKVSLTPSDQLQQAQQTLQSSSPSSSPAVSATPGTAKPAPLPLPLLQPSAMQSVVPPAMRPLDYSTLANGEDVKNELERTIADFGKMLECVDLGLGRLIAGTWE